MKRILTALVLGPVSIYTVLFAPWPLFVLVVALVASLCFLEYARITESFAPLGLAAGLLILLAPPAETTIILFLAALAAMCLPLAAREPEKAVARSGLLVLGILYVFGGWKTGILLHDLGNQAQGHLASGRNWLMFALVVNWAGDTGAYYAGRRWGRRKLAPHISPGKTWEGSAASVFTSMTFGLIYLPIAIPGTPLWKAGVLSLAANIAGQLGDLAESAIKRGAGVKDSGSLLPGHGGMLDRVDSSLFSLPVLYTLVGFLEKR
jgi:phosphatidate cytidylyltransferase